ncbi:MAG TPA: DUF1761 domain-containing protein [Candidatus Saccharimonadales bacterium]
MEVAVNWWAIVLAALSSMAVGSIWYAKSTFGKEWMRLIGKTEKQLNQTMWPIVITLLVSFVTAFVLAHVTYLSNKFFGNSFLQDALSTAFWLWLGLVAARFLTHDLFENRPLKLTVMNIGHELITLLVMALIIGLMQP